MVGLSCVVASAGLSPNSAPYTSKSMMVLPSSGVPCCRPKRTSTAGLFRPLMFSSGRPSTSPDDSYLSSRGRWSAVDDGMLVLRRRIYERKMAEMSYQPPIDDWEEWEKNYYRSGKYALDVFEAVGLLQSLFMNLRPRTAVGILLVVASSVVVAGATLVFHAAAIARIILGAVQANLPKLAR